MHLSDAGTFSDRVQAALEAFAELQRERLTQAGPYAGTLVDAALTSGCGPRSASRDGGPPAAARTAGC
jgi:hypothetical protein